MNKFETVTKFVKEHPFITIGAVLLCDRWISAIFKGSPQKARDKAVIDVEFEVKGDNKGNE